MPCEHARPPDTDRVNPRTVVRSLVTIIEAYAVKAKRNHMGRSNGPFGVGQ